jgi:1-acyl-sn-glycerol-3-phosphate acyltransferase
LPDVSTFFRIRYLQRVGKYMSVNKGVVQIKVGESLPKSGGVMLKGMTKLIMASLGWTIRGELPNVPKFVVIGAPHTSTWDWFLVMATAYALNVRISWMMKHTMFRGPLGGLLRRLGGVSINRREMQGVVEDCVANFRQLDKFVLCITPEGTRNKVREWKKGFYHIATGAEVPIVPAIFDYGLKQVRFAPAFTPTGDLAADLSSLQALYAGVTPRNPHLF